MFARWGNVRLRAAQKALRQGRVDDCFGLCQQPEVRDHAAAGPLLDDLAKALLARARLHRQAGRYAAALEDLDRVEQIGRGSPDTATLRAQLRDHLQSAADREADNRQAYQRAAERLRAGRLESVRHDVQRVNDETQRIELARELEQRVQRSSEVLHQAEDALARDDVLTAVRLWQDASRRFGRTRETETFAARLASPLRTAVMQWSRDGQIERALAARSAVETLLPITSVLAECDRLLRLLARAVHELANGDHASLRQTLLRLKGMQTDAPWIDAALAAAGEIQSGQEALTASPLGVCASVAPRRASPAADLDVHSPEAETMISPAPATPISADALPLTQPLLVLVDGGGSSLLVHGDRIRLGRGGSQATVDVPLTGDVEPHHADVIRRGADYFLNAYGPATVNQRPVEHTLLRDGDRITLGSKMRMVFHKPSAKSDTAVLRLSHRCRLPQDVRDIVLFQETCLVGQSLTCHLRTTEGDGQLVLFERGGHLHARQTSGKGWTAQATMAIAAGETIELGDMRLTIKRYNGQSG
jgi:tetratricopeptide (TPR) repeat protein